MTGGRAVILGEVGRNFGAGMSGGIAYVYNPNQTLEVRANAAMIDFDPMDKSHCLRASELTTKHLQYTGSKIAGKILDNWDEESIHFVKVMPKALKEVLAAQDKQALKGSLNRYRVDYIGASPKILSTPSPTTGMTELTAPVTLIGTVTTLVKTQPDKIQINKA